MTPIQSAPNASLATTFLPAFAVGTLLQTVGVFCFLTALRMETVGVHLLFFGLAVGLSGVAVFLFALQSFVGTPGRSGAAAFDQIFSNSPEAALLTDGSGKLLGQNAAAQAMSSLGPATAADWLAGLSQAGPAVAYRLLRAAMDGGSAKDVVPAMDGRELHIVATRLEPGRFAWTVRALSPARGDRVTSEAAEFPILRCDPDGAVLSANGAARRLLDGALPAHVGEITREERADHGDFVHLRDTDQTRARVHVIPQPGGGSTVALLPVSADEIARALPIDFMDILPVALARVNAQGQLTYLNRAAQKLLGAASTTGAPLADFVEGLGRSIPERVSEMMKGRGHNPTEVGRVRVDGEERFIQLTLKRLELDGAASLLAVMADATEFKALEAQFVQSQKMQAVGQLAGGMAHDFNNLLTAITGHCDLLLLRHPVHDPDYEDLKQINQNSARAAALVAKLLAFSRKQTMVPRVVDIEGTLADLRHLLNRLLGERVDLRIEQGEALPKVRVDERQIEQVIMNLVVNARDAMPQGGDVTIRSSAVTYAQNTERDGATIPAGDYLRIEVTDTGTGIPDEVIGKIFEPFFTTKGVGKGTGLGLSTAYGIIKQMGGFIFATSRLNVGTTFTLLLPAHWTEANAEALTLVPDLAQQMRDLSGREVILLVEDEDPVRSVAAQALNMRGYKVLEAGTAEEALEILEDEALHVDMFVSDVIMPGKDGPTWVREARKKRPNAKVIFVSGYAEDVFDGGTMDIENAAFLPKPFSLVELSHTVKEQLSA